VAWLNGIPGDQQDASGVRMPECGMAGEK